MNLFHFETGLWVIYVACFKDVFMTFNLGIVCLSHCVSLKESCKDEGQRKKAERTIKELMFWEVLMELNTCHSTIHFEFSFVIPWNSDLLLRPFHSSLSSMRKSVQTLLSGLLIAATDEWEIVLWAPLTVTTALLLCRENHRLNSALPIFLSVISGFLKCYLLIFRSLRLYFVGFKVFGWGILLYYRYILWLLDFPNFIIKWVHITKPCQTECPFSGTPRLRPHTEYLWDFSSSSECVFSFCHCHKLWPGANPHRPFCLG